MKVLIPLMIVFLTACASTTVTCPDGRVVASEDLCLPPMPPEPEVKAPAAPEPEVAEPEPEPAEMDAELAALIEKGQKAMNYQFGWAPIEFSSGQMVTIQQRTYYVKGGKARVEIPVPTVVDPETFVPLVYLDFAAETARGWCSNDELRECDRYGEERPASYDDYVIKLPVACLDEIPNSAAMKKGPSFGGRQVQVVEYSAGEQHVQMYLDSFFGVPLRAGIYSDPAFEDLTGGVEFQEAAFNQVQDEDVTFPG